MSRLTASAVLVLSICAAALALPAFAQACDCLGPGPEDEIGPYYAQRIKDADGAIIGKVMKVRHTGESTPDLNDGEGIFTVRVRQAFKRSKAFPEGDKIRIHTAANGALCGLELPEGSVAGLFLDRTDGQWRGNSCGQAPPRWMRKGAAYLHGGKGGMAVASAGCAASVPAAV